MMQLQKQIEELIAARPRDVRFHVVSKVPRIGRKLRSFKSHSRLGAFCKFVIARFIGLPGVTLAEGCAVIRVVVGEYLEICPPREMKVLKSGVAEGWAVTVNGFVVLSGRFYHRSVVSTGAAELCRVEGLVIAWPGRSIEIAE